MPFKELQAAARANTELTREVRIASFVLVSRGISMIRSNEVFYDTLWTMQGYPDILPCRKSGLELLSTGRI